MPNIVELEPTPLGGRAFISRALIGGVPHTRIKDVTDRFAANALSQPSLGSFLNTLAREHLPDAVVKVGRRELKDWGWYLRDDHVGDLEILLNDPKTARQASSRFHAVRTARTHKEITVNAVSPTPITLAPLYTVRDTFRLRITEKRKLSLAGITVHTEHGDVPVVEHEGQLYVAPEYLSMAWRGSELKGHSGLLHKYSQKFKDDGVIRVFMDGHTKAMAFIDIRRLDVLCLCCPGQLAEDRARMVPVNETVRRAVSTWQTAKTLAGLPTIVEEPAPAPSEPEIEIKVAGTVVTEVEPEAPAAPQQPKLSEVIQTFPAKMDIMAAGIATIMQRLEQVEDANPADTLNLILANQRTIMADHKTLLAVLGGMARGAMAAVEG